MALLIVPCTTDHLESSSGWVGGPLDDRQTGKVLGSQPTSPLILCTMVPAPKRTRVARWWTQTLFRRTCSISNLSASISANCCVLVQLLMRPHLRSCRSHRRNHVPAEASSTIFTVERINELQAWAAHVFFFLSQEQMVREQRWLQEGLGRRIIKGGTRRKGWNK